MVAQISSSPLVPFNVTSTRAGKARIASAYSRAIVHVGYACPLEYLP